MKLTVLGCSDAFASGERFHSCYLLETGRGRLMIDCGATGYLAWKRSGLALSGIDAVVISHCHGDHYGGLPFLFLEKTIVDRSETPLIIIGPEGIAGRTEGLIDSMYAGLRGLPRAKLIEYREMTADRPFEFQGLQIEPRLAFHDSGSPSLMFSIADGAKRFAFSGDTGWCDQVGPTGRNADLFLIECTSIKPQTPQHLNLETLAGKWDEIGAKSYLLTHMGEDMLALDARTLPARVALAYEGLTIEF
jgi:ribonuclease BN (tRNA processing enzyme)